MANYYVQCKCGAYCDEEQCYRCLKKRIEELEQRLRDKEKCPRCGGSGQPTDSDFSFGMASACRECNGTGKKST